MQKLFSSFVAFLSVVLSFVVTAPAPVLAGPLQAVDCTRYVAVNGNDSNTGQTIAAPLRTIQKAANLSVAGDVVCVRAGVYYQRINITRSGQAGQPVTFQSYPGERAVLDGGNLTVPAAVDGLVHVKGADYIVFKNFEVRNYRTSTADVVPVGIRISGLAHHVEIRNNAIHHIEHNGTSSNGTDAHGIAVYGTSGVTAIHDITIDRNHLYNLKLGSSEGLVINGNVENWWVTNNTLHDMDNIGIDAIGYEQTAPANDQARNGFITGNHVYNIDTYGNPAYGTERSASCIYVDGGKSILIHRNRVHHCNLGIEIASEHQTGSTSYITVRNNLIYSNTEVGLAMGGYDTQRGSTTNCVVVNNTLFKNNTSNDWGAELYIQYKVNNNIIQNNIIYAGSARRYIGSWSNVMTGNLMDYNLFFSAGGAGGYWEWKGVTYTGFGAYRTASGNDAHSLNSTNPLLTSNYRLQSGSPAINAGLAHSKSGPVDVDGQPRIQNGVIDIGADEAP